MHHELTFGIFRVNLMVNPKPCLKQPALSMQLACLLAINV